MIISVYQASSVFPSLPSLSAMTGMTAAYSGDTPGAPEADHSHTHEGGHSPGQWYGGSGYHEPHYNRCGKYRDLEISFFQISRLNISSSQSNGLLCSVTRLLANVYRCIFLIRNDSIRASIQILTGCGLLK